MLKKEKEKCHGFYSLRNYKQNSLHRCKSVLFTKGGHSSLAYLYSLLGVTPGGWSAHYFVHLMIGK